jgi:uncharacterized protein (TIGR00369 family)
MRRLAASVRACSIDRSPFPRPYRTTGGRLSTPAGAAAGNRAGFDGADGPDVERPVMPARTPEFPQYDAAIAQAFLRASEAATGLPAYLGARITDLGPGRLVAEMEVRAELLTPFGTLHGGVMAGFVDHVLGCVLYPLMARGQWAATTEFKLNYLVPVRGGTLVAESTVLSLGKRTAVVRVEVTCGEQSVCLAQGTLLVSEPPKKGQ